MSLTRPEDSALIRDFSGGYLDTPESNFLPRNGSPDGRNGFFYAVQLGEGQRADLGKRPGHRLLNPTVMDASKAVKALVEFRRETAAPKLLAICNGNLKQYDDINAFALVSGGGVFTVDAKARTCSIKNNLYLADGTVTKRFNGTAVFEVGFAAPTSAPGLALGAATGVTGTYEGVATWYDSVEDHESSPSVSSTAVAFTNQKRVWTKPSGSPPANVTHWRVYARRTDTNEVNYYRVGTVAIGTTTLTEAIADPARVDKGPEGSSNDPPTGAFAWMELYKGYAVAARADSGSIEFSKLNDAESWHPRDRFPVHRDGTPVRAGKRYGTTFLAFKPTKTYQLVGDRVPFKIDDLHSSYGNVNQDAGIEIDNLLYAWDEVRGPYVTDTLTWRSLADGTIKTVLAQVDRSASEDIRVGHDPGNNLVVWAVPTTSSRKRTILAYHYLLQHWLWPITGMEWASFATFRATDGTVGLYMGDEWGRVYKMFDSDLDGAPAANTYEATVTSATSATVTASAASLYTTGSGLVGMPVAVRSPEGTWQFRRIASNTGTQITLDTTNGVVWSVTPSAGWTVYVGPIEWYWLSPWLEYGTFDEEKKAGWLAIQAQSTARDTTLSADLRVNDSPSTSHALSFAFPASGAVWDESNWDEANWSDAGNRSAVKQSMARLFWSLQVKLSNYYPQQPVRIVQLVAHADEQPRKKVPGNV